MASGNSRSEYGNWGLDKGELNLDYCDVGLGLKLPWQQQQTAPQGSSLQQQRHNITGGVPWLHNRQETSRVIFTAGQRQELERQTIIYKYMMSSLPVPPELLIPFSKYPSSNSPITTSSSPSEVGRKTGVEMRYTMSSRGGDPEPWRCRRTDGKKWRCSRDVAPDQKYCERHSHKGRPSRSRKPVEPSSSSSLLTSTNNNNLALPSVTTTSNTSTFFSPYTLSKPSSSPSSFDLPCPPQFSSLPRYPDWFMKKDVAPTATSMYPQHQIVTGDTTSSQHLNDDHHQNCLLPRPFIDAWSLADPKNATNNVIDNENNNTLATNKGPPLTSSLNSILPLTLSMSAGVDPENHDTGDNMKDHLEIRSSSSSNNQPLYWMNSWGSSPGGPLAEALCLGISGTGNGLMSSHSDDHLVSPHGCSTSSSTTTLG